jgi:membrane associated rhomboid family serine protease
MSSPDLFVVCKSCGAEVSPYITECPYCGNRLRKRAPKLDRPGKPTKPSRPSRPLRPSRGTRRPSRPRRERAPRSGRPMGTIILVGLSVLVTLAVKLSATVAEETILIAGTWEEEPWRLLTTLFVYDSAGYQAVLLGCIFLFGWLLERRHGPLAPVAVFLLAGIAGTAAAAAYHDDVFLLGAPGAGMGLVAAWSVPALLARRSGETDEDWDLLGAAVFAVLLLALPLAVREAHVIEGVAGGLVGLAAGLPLARSNR